MKNPDWLQSTDTLRHQYFNGITITEGQNATTIQQELQTGDADDKRTLLEQAIATARDLGCAGIERHATELMEGM